LKELSDILNMTGKTLQPGESGMEHDALRVEAVQEQLAEIRDQSEKEKIPLTKEVEEYTRANLRKVQEKLAKGEPVYPADMEFIGKVKLWMEMPMEWRERLKSIKEMEEDDVVTSRVVETEKRGISLKQWLALKHLEEFTPRNISGWIDKRFRFPGGGKIMYVGPFRLVLTSDLKVFPDNLSIQGLLDIQGCSGLENLPINLSIDGDLILEGCTGLRGLPESLTMGGDLYISKNMAAKVKTDAEMLKKMGKIKGEIKIK